MSVDQQVRADFDTARRKASWRRIISGLTGRRNELLQFDDVRRQLRTEGQHHAGFRSVPLDAIVGSVGRNRDFDTVFLPRQTQTRARWLNIDRAHYEDQKLPPVELYGLGETYFVKDGNHRVSVARQQGQLFIDAVVIELHTPVPIGSLADLEAWIAQQDAVAFLAATHLADLRPDAHVILTLPGQYERLLEHISVHRWFLGIEQQREMAYPDAVVSWYEHVYLPLVEGIRQAGILRDFPSRTEADLYLWLIEHLWYLRQAGELDEDIPLDAAARSYARTFSERLAHRLTRAVRRGARRFVGR